MDDQQGFIVGVGCGRTPVEAAGDDDLAIDHSELVVEFAATGKAGGADALCLQWF